MHAPGTRLRELQICEILSASRGSVRKALGRLAFEGLVELEHNRGASVARPTAVDTADLFAARKCIEVAIACEAAARMTPEALNALDAHLELERRSFREGDSDAIVRLSGDFHVLLTDIAANLALKRYLEDIIARESLIIQLYKKACYHDCSADEHALILEALKSGDCSLIAERIESHIDSIANNLDLNPQPAPVRELEEILNVQ